MPTARLYHNADCSKCRGALALLLERGIDVEVVDYIEHPPTLAELRDLVLRLGVPVRALLRPGSTDAADLEDAAVPDEGVLAALQANPRWLQRPILVLGDRAVIARPPERVLDLLERPE